jgi:hypothetical protein
MLQKVPLNLEDALGDPVEGLLSLMDALDEPDCGADFFLKVFPGSLLFFPFLSAQAAV